MRSRKNWEKSARCNFEYMPSAPKDKKVPHASVVATVHTPVLLKEVLEGLDIRHGDVVVDGTLNRAGHALRMCESAGKKGVLVGIDRDADALAEAGRALRDAPCTVFLHQENFKNISQVLDVFGVPHANKVLFDLGMSSDQLVAGRGFSFQRNEPLLMTFNPHPSPEEVTAEEVVNTWEEDNIADVLFGYGEERFARRIARAIVTARKEAPIRTTGDLVRIIESSVPAFYKKKGTHPATKTFQALRTVVNDEIESAKEGIRNAFDRLSAGGRLAVISFHSIEDRMVKRAFAEMKKSGLGTILTKKPITPSREEVDANPRARSAKLRIVQKN